MKTALFVVFIGVFALTAILTLMGLIGWVTISSGYLTSLVSAFLLQLAGTVIAAFRGAKLFEPPKYVPLEDYVPEGDALRVLATLWHYQKIHVPQGQGGQGRWIFTLPTNDAGFPALLVGLGELLPYGLVEVQQQNFMCNLSTLGIQKCPKWEKRFKGVPLLFVA